MEAMLTSMRVLLTKIRVVRKPPSSKLWSAFGQSSRMSSSKTQYSEGSLSKVSTTTLPPSLFHKVLGYSKAAGQCKAKLTPVFWETSASASDPDPDPDPDPASAPDPDPTSAPDPVSAPDLVSAPDPAPSSPPALA